jgi:hypothetical protein
MTRGLSRFWAGRRPGLPSAYTALAVVPLAAAIGASIRQQTDPDYWWHVSVGSWILDHGDVPHAQWISWLADKPGWISQEWAGEVAMALADRMAGTLGSVWLFAIVTAAIWAVFISLCRVVLGNEARPLTIGLLTLLAYAGAMGVLAPRLQLLTILWALLVVRLVYGYLQAGERKRIWLLPLVMIAWANTHLGSVLLAYPLLVGLAVGDMVSRRHAPGREFLALAGLALLAPVVNPYGVAVYTFPFQTIFSPVAQSMIQEWESPDFHQLVFRGLQLYLVGLVLILPFSRPRVGIPAALVSGGLLAMTLQSARYAGPFALIATALLAPALVGGARSWLTRLGYRPTPFRRPTQYALCLVAVVFLAGQTILVGARMTDGGAQSALVAQTEPVAATAALGPLLAAKPEVRIFTEYQWGGYVNRITGRKVGLYGASEAFSDGALSDGAATLYLLHDPGPYLDDHQIGLVLISPSTALRFWLEREPGWSEVYSDSTAVAFLRD